MRQPFARLALLIPPIRRLYDERNHLRQQLGELIARGSPAPGGATPARPESQAEGALAFPRLHVGCGPVKLEGWCNVDVFPTTAVDVLDDVRRLSRFRDGSADEIYACHVLEHFAHAEVPSILRRWREVLRSGGRLRVSVPDLDKIVKLYVDHWGHFQTDGNSPWIGLIYGGQLDAFDFHKTGFNFCWLRRLLLDAGFRTVETYPSVPHFIPGVKDASTADSPFGTPFSLNVLATT